MNQAKARPSLLEIAVVLGCGLGAAVMGTAKHLVFGIAGGALFGICVLVMFAVVVSAVNFAHLPSGRRAPFSQCVIAPFKTGMALLLLGRWPGNDLLKSRRSRRMLRRNIWTRGAKFRSF